MLSGHMDVVPAEEADWRSDPFTLTEAGDRYVGRGAADMKGFLALAVNRLAAADRPRSGAPLALLFTYDEEVGTLGARRFTETSRGGRRCRGASIIGEPTALRVVRAHKGMVRLRLGSPAWPRTGLSPPGPERDRACRAARSSRWPTLRRDARGGAAAPRASDFPRCPLSRSTSAR